MADVTAPPNVNPPTPILLPALDDNASEPPTFALVPCSSCPGRGVSHATHTVTSVLFLTMHESHFQLPASLTNIPPHDEATALDDDETSLSVDSPVL